jgi:pimeloyl-ACP methyl ester carboxylesterase
LRSPLRTTTRSLFALGVSLVAPCAGPESAPTPLTGARDVVFTDYSPLSSNTELARRLLTPLTAARIPQLLAQSGNHLSEQPVNLAEEKFVLYVPAQAPARGYALLVFVPPWQQSRLPEGWHGVLDRYGIIFVSAARSGNDASPLGRRMPLALLAAHNIMQRYAVDSERVYIGGFSGGSRVALRLALGYPDVFRGALLNAGSDPIGNADRPLPQRELFIKFQESTRLVYVTGDEDPASLTMDVKSMHSMWDWCVFDIDTEVTPRAVHERATPVVLAKALRALLNPVAPDPGKLAACRSSVEAKLNAQLEQVQSLLAAGKRDDAQKLLQEVDARFGGLAAPRSLELARQAAIATP